jgi:hypothetical protein
VPIVYKFWESQHPGLNGTALPLLLAEKHGVFWKVEYSCRYWIGCALACLINWVIAHILYMRLETIYGAAQMAVQLKQDKSSTITKIKTIACCPASTWSSCSTRCSVVIVLLSEKCFLSISLTRTYQAFYSGRVLYEFRLEAWLRILFHGFCQCYRRIYFGQDRFLPYFFFSKSYYINAAADHLWSAAAFMALWYYIQAGGPQLVCSWRSGPWL